MAEQTQTLPDLVQLFGAALQGLTAQRQEINALDGYNGNHGDNMVQNLQLVTESLKLQAGKSPAEALRNASNVLKNRGLGGTSQYYSEGLNQAAEKLAGHNQLEQDDVMTLVQSLLGAVPAEGYPQQGQPTQSVLDLVLGMAGAQAAPRPQPQAQSQGGGVLEMLAGLAGAALGQPPQTQAQPEDDKFDAGDVLERLLPAGMAFLQARQSGANASQAMQQALISALLGGQMQPQQAKTPRAAAGSLIAKSMLQMLFGK